MMAAADAAEQVLSMAARDLAVSDDMFVMISRAVQGLDPVTGERPEPRLPARMDRGWRHMSTFGVEVAYGGGDWFWRCRRRSCRAWGGPFRSESQAASAGRENRCEHPSRGGSR